MKIVHWAAIVVVALFTLMNLGTVTGGTPAVVIVFGIVLGLGGLASVYGLVRRTPWARTVALAVTALNIVLAMVGLIVGWEGWDIGLVINVVALLLLAVDRPATRSAQPELS
jgi:uncharacterized membrane protein YecN with MAPEG domain